MLIKSQSAAAAGTVAVQDDGPVPAGVHAYTARQRDPAGNLGPISPALSVTFTPTGPTFVPGIPDLLASSDTGRDSADNITRATSPTFNISPVESGVLVQLLRKPAGAPDSSYVLAAAPRSGPGNVQDGGPLADGRYEYAALEVDGAGNLGPISATLTVTIDTAAQPPAAPDLQAGSDRGDSSTDDITSDNRPWFDLAGVEVGALIQLLRNGAVVASEPAAAGTTVSLRDSGPVADGMYAYTARQTDIAGNVSTLGGPFVVTVDVTAPVVSSLTLPDADDGAPQGDGATNVTRPHLTGTTEPGLAVDLLSGATVLGTTTADAAGAFSLQPGADLADGKYSLVARARNLAGNAGISPNPLALTIHTIRSTPPTLSLLPSSDSGSKNNDGITNVRRPQFVGTAPVGLTVELVEGQTVLNTATADANGVFNVRPTADLTAGTHTIYARVRDGMGNTSASLNLLVTIDLTPPAPPTSVRLVAADDTGVKGDAVTALRRPRVGGTAEPGATVSLLDGKGNVLGTATASTFDGSFTVKPAANLPYGVNALAVRATDVAGNASTTVAASVTVIRVAGDFDGDGIADLSSFTPTTAVWRITQSSAGLRTQQFGAPNGTDIPRLADYDGDARSDLSLYRATTAETIAALSGGGALVRQFGAARTDIPVEADYDGDGKSDFAVFRPSTAIWYIAYSGGGSKVQQFGQANVDVPLQADFDGDGKADFAVYRPTTAQWLIYQSTAGAKVLQFGDPRTDIPVPLDYDGDGKADLAVFRKPSAQWIILQSTKGGRIETSGLPNERLSAKITRLSSGNGRGWAPWPCPASIA